MGLKLIDKVINKLEGNTHPEFLKYQGIEGWLTYEEAKGLKKVASLLPTEGVIVEIGSWKGKSTYCLRYGLQKGTIHCIDPFNADGEESSKKIYEEQKGTDSLRKQFLSNIHQLKNNVEIVVHEGYSADFINEINQCDFLFIDGDHSIEGCKYDFVNYGPKIKSGGFLAFHDYYADRKDLGPTWVVQNLVNKNDHYELHKIWDSLIVFRKKK